MPSETFYCPHCRRQLTKSAQAFVLGEMFKKKSGFIGLGDLPPDVTCPGCGGRIDAMKMIKGEYDIDPKVRKMLPLYGWGIIAAIILFRFVVHWSWILSILAGIIAGMIAEQALAGLFRSVAGKKPVKN